MGTPSAVEDIFLAALHKATLAERAAYLDEVCKDAPELRQCVERLLSAQAEVGSFLDKPPLVATTADEPCTERPGTIIAHYRLMEQIGEGGMGLVFVAEQQEPVRRKVALKIIKPGMDSRNVIARFEAERQALAIMDHQNIARVLDGGTTQSGRPYFVMELVHGIPITEFCDANRLTPRQRLELFVQVCHGIQHAHQKGIIHRDIKPSNILVTMYDDRPVPKIIDFGVAKAIEQRLTEKTVYTQFGTLIGTFEYMSPEQAEMNALGVDTRSDIYSLGVLLYELLTGSTPLERPRLREAAFGEIVRLIKEEEPPRPSVRLSTSGALAKVAAARQTDPARLSGLMRGELDWVVMRCLEKDRTRRYDTASGLARDVDRYLKDEAVEARPPSTGYRLRKIIQRNRVAVFLTLFVLAAMTAILFNHIVGHYRIRHQRDRAIVAEAKANREKENAQAALDFLWQEVLSQASPWQVADRELKVRTLIDRAAERLEAGSAQSPLVEATIRRMMGQLYTELGEPRKARRYLEKALEVQRRELGDEDPQTLATSHTLGRCLCIANHYDEAAPILIRTLELCQKVLGEQHLDTLKAMRWAAIVHTAQGRYTEGEQLIRRAMDLLTRLPGNQERERLQSRLFLCLSLATRGDLATAETELTGCLHDAQVVLDADDYPPALAVIRNLALVYLARNEPARAEPLAVDALRRIRVLLGDQHPYTLTTLRVLARALQLQGRHIEAAPLLAEAEQGYRRIQEVGDPRLAIVLGMRGFNLILEHRYAEAERPLRECLALWEKRLPHAGEFWIALSRRGAERERAHAKCLLGVSLMARQNYSDAEPLLLQGYEELKPRSQFQEDATPFARRQRIEALGWLTQLYQECGKPEMAAARRKELEGLKAAPNFPAKKP